MCRGRSPAPQTWRWVPGASDNILGHSCPAGDSALPTWEEGTGPDLGGGEEHPMGKRCILATAQPLSNSPGWGGRADGDALTLGPWLKGEGSWNKLLILHSAPWLPERYSLPPHFHTSLPSEAYSFFKLLLPCRLQSSVFPPLDSHSPVLPFYYLLLSADNSCVTLEKPLNLSVPVSSSVKAG